MKNRRIMRSPAATSSVIALFAGSARPFTPCPRVLFGFPGFLLDGSEGASNRLKILQDAAVNNRKIGIDTDDNWAHAYCGQVSGNGYTDGACKIVAISVGP